MREWRCKGWSIIYEITFVVILKYTLNVFVFKIKYGLEALIVCSAQHGFHINIKVMLPINKKLAANRYHPSLCQLRARVI